MSSQEQEVKEFFNRTAAEYRTKYSGRDAFHHYFFTERLFEATRGFDFKNKKVLDIGAGTGNLYDYLLEKEPQIDYYASDIAGDMLSQSRIPAHRRFEGLCYNVNFPVSRFDYIFMLGVTTYLDDEELGRIVEFIKRSLDPDGIAVVSFTNRSSIDWQIRKISRRGARVLAPGKYVIAQQFEIFPRDVQEAERLCGDGLGLEEVRWINHTLFPLSQILKSPSVRIAQAIHRRQSSRFLNLLSSDFLLILRRDK
jgi:SAM-dependent methyltransferase